MNFQDHFLVQIEIMHEFDENDCINVVYILALLLFPSSSSYRIANDVFKNHVIENCRTLK